MRRPEPPPGPYLIVGLARSGQAAALALRARGEQVIGLDSGHPPGMDSLADAGVELHLGEGDGEGGPLVRRANTIVKSPGVPTCVPVVQQALSHGKLVIGELELAWRMLANEFVAVTGTNGKTTTVELIGHIHRVAGAPVAVAGNVGAALSGFVGRLDAQATVVCEVSSFQLEDAIAFAPEVAVLLNVAPDHLDRHGTLAAYTEAKVRIFAHQQASDVAVLPAGLDVGPIPGAARRVSFGEGADADLSLSEGTLHWHGDSLLAAGEMKIPGRHNLENAMAAAAACLARGLDPLAVREGLRTFAGVAHRLELVAERDGVRYVNDSKATNVASTLVALDASAGGRSSGQPSAQPDQPSAQSSVHLILGGQGKGQDFSALRDAVQRSCRGVYLIGEDAPLIVTALAGVQVPVESCGTLEHAVEKARERAQAGEMVLLSPACASFDQFADYEARGNRFRELVGAA
ncbi:MAG TPA: UDP-N-acetylmuramoyl-L-alanine--D-glutamate ligase [Solirubrobacteraceae bacterium]|nr:UDP-N-acetylmuramoyl-L-alanine--D-glutamate ligase [Solirubrobacteraceae bacterium]